MLKRRNRKHDNRDREIRKLRFMRQYKNRKAESQKFLITKADLADHGKLLDDLN